MDDYSDYKVRKVDYSVSKILTIEVDNIGILAEFNVYHNIGHSGGYGSVWLRDISLDEVINLRDQLTKVIDEKVATLNSNADKIAMEVADCMDGLAVKK